MDLPEYVVLKSSRVKWFFVTLAGLIFIFGGYLMLGDGDQTIMAWLTIVFFGAVALIGLKHLIRPSTLELGPDGFIQRAMGRTLSYRWDEVSEFGVYSIRAGLIKTNSFVNFTPVHHAGSKSGKISKALTGGSAQLSDTFGLKAPELAELMNQYRQNSLSKD